jgi:phosphoglycerol transferase MdoB-like AlkP superfamily enzyme
VLHPDGERARTRSSVLGCSLDIAPTILGFLGGSYSSVFFGRDLNAVPSGEGYALMQHNHSVALLDAQSELTVLDSGRRLTKYKVDPETLQLGPLPYEEANLDVSALFQTAYEMYYGDKCYPSEPRPAPLDLARDGELPDGGARSMERH